MDIGIKLQAFNYKMRERRLEMELTQHQLATYSGAGITVVQYAETYVQPKGKIAPGKFINRLYMIADYLNLEFEELFPEEYIEAMKDDRLLKKGTFYIRTSISLESLEAITNPVLITDGDLNQRLIQTDVNEAILNALNYLENEDQKDVLRLRFGLDCDPMTLLEVGKLKGLTPERIRQIEARALRLLRHPKVSRKLRELL